jgi:ketosteroid isomerase-like protein
MRLFSQLTVAALCLSAAAALFAAEPRDTAETETLRPDSASVAATVNGFQNALSSGDSAAALALLAPDAVILESGGIETRSEYRSHHLSGDVSFARAVKSVRSQLKVTVSGTTAWTTSTSTTQGDYNGRAINSTGAESMVLSKTAAGWRIRQIHWSSRNRRPAA